MPIKKENFKKIEKSILACKKCSLYRERIQPVVGQGNYKAKIMFIGEAPGKNEDMSGVPFCGKSGKILDELLKSIKIKREDVYICNIIKCRPPLNRDPEEKEIKACKGYIIKQIEAINPKVIVPLGRYSMKFVLENFGLENNLDVISKLHGKVFSFKNKKIIPLYHPAVSVYNPNTKKVLKKDFKVLKEYVN